MSLQDETPLSYLVSTLGRTLLAYQSIFLVAFPQITLTLTTTNLIQSNPYILGSDTAFPRVHRMQPLTLYTSQPFR